MFGKSIELFKLFGFSVKIDLSWVVIAVLITWTLANGFFPQAFPDQTPATYWAMGVAGMLGLFVSIVLHELSHSLVARRHGMQMKGITLFIFGGVAEMTDEPPSPKAEFQMAIAGPIASVVIAAVCFAVYRTGDALAWPVPVVGVFGELALINAVLVAFNLVPAFPLDGGRVLRAALWHLQGNIRRATRITSQIGAGFGIFLIILGVISFISGNFIGGMWYFLIGMFLRGAAQMSYQQLIVRRALEGEPVSRFMKTDPVTVPPELPLAQLVDQYVYHHHFKMYPVVDHGRLLGCVTTRHVRDVPRDEWTTRTVGDIVDACSEANTMPPTLDAMEALTRMNQNQASRAMVVENGTLVGVISLKDMMQFLSTKIELEGN
ncbi:MAG: CBS domain-containing protein [Planctomycetota bacterium]|nr:MAG: CBS domain-containing protein [Planctomycetota bacterium]